MHIALKSKLWSMHARKNIQRDFMSHCCYSYCSTTSYACKNQMHHCDTTSMGCQRTYFMSQKTHFFWTAFWIKTTMAGTNVSAKKIHIKKRKRKTKRDYTIK